MTLLESASRQRTTGRPRPRVVKGSKQHRPPDDRRLGWLVAVFAVACLILVARLAQVQVLAPDKYLDHGEAQRTRLIPLDSQRGSLLDRNGEELAISLPQPVLWADPQLVADPAGEAMALAPHTNLQPVEIQRKLASSGRYVVLSRDVDLEAAAAIEELDLPGVFIEEVPERFMPGGDQLLRSVIGFVGVDREGLSGLELQYDDALSGDPGELIAEQAIDGRTIPDGARELRPAEDGADMVLTIDRALQFEAEQSLAATVEATGARGGTVVIMDPATGEILAMASLGRDEDGNVVSTSDNRAVTWTFDPGSVMKAMTFSAVLEEGIAGPNTPRSVPYQLDIYEETFTDTELYDEKMMTPTDILVRSSNTGTILWADELTDPVLDSYLRDFGYGSNTGLSFPGESDGIFPSVDQWSGTSFATIAIGQGITATPLQVLTSFNVLANDGVYVPPLLVQETVAADGERTPSSQAQPHTVVSPETADAVTQMLSRVVFDGTARDAGVPGYTIAAKTGTARKVQETGGYEDYLGNFQYVSTVAGFFPAEDPAFSMVVVIDEPTTDIYASIVAAPLFGELAAWTLRHYQVSPPAAVVLQDAPTTEGPG